MASVHRSAFSFHPCSCWQSRTKRVQSAPSSPRRKSDDGPDARPRARRRGARLGRGLSGGFLMSRYRGDWDDDFYAGEARPRRGDEGPEFERPRGRYEYDAERGPRGERSPGVRGDYDDAPYGRGDFYRDDYYAGGRLEGRDFREEQEYRRRLPPAPPREGRGGRRGASRSHLRCRDIMTRDVTVAARETTLEEVARMMREEDTGVIPVGEPGETASDSVTAAPRAPARAGSNGRLVGLITDRDIVVRAIAEGADARTARAESVMTTDLHTVRPNDRVIEAIRKMGDRQVRRLPV